MTRSGLIEKVKLKLDEYIPGNVTHPISNYIDSCLVEAARTLILEMPIEKLPWDHHTNIYSLQSYSLPITIYLQSNVLRIVSIKLPSWKRPISKFYNVGSKEEALQSHESTKGTVDRPVVIIEKTRYTNQVGLEIITKLIIYGGSLSNIAEANLKVVYELTPENIPSNLTDPLIYLASALVAQIMERDKASQILMAHYQKYLQ